MNKSVFDIVYEILDCYLKENEITKKMIDESFTFLKKDILSKVINELKNGWTYEELIVNIRNIIRTTKNFDFDKLNLYNKKRINLLNPKRIYFHNQIRLVKGIDPIIFDYNTGEIIKDSTDDYFLEMKASYTIEDLYDYCLHNGILTDSLLRFKERNLGALRWLIKHFDLELVLYAIDICANENGILTNLNSLQDYIDRAREKYNMALANAKATGELKIVPKRRMLSD